MAYDDTFVLVDHHPVISFVQRRLPLLRTASGCFRLSLDRHFIDNIHFFSLRALPVSLSHLIIIIGCIGCIDIQIHLCHVSFKYLLDVLNIWLEGATRARGVWFRSGLRRFWGGLLLFLSGVCLDVLWVVEGIAVDVAGEVGEFVHVGGECFEPAGAGAALAVVAMVTVVVALVVAMVVAFLLGAAVAAVALVATIFLGGNGDGFQEVAGAFDGRSDQRTLRETLKLCLWILANLT